MNPQIAPWEDPNLPAPVAVIERPIEGRTRRFALWFWDGRLVWRDRYNQKLWWATFDQIVGEPIEVWERAIETKRFGRASCETHSLCGNGADIGLPVGVEFKTKYSYASNFYVVLDEEGNGIACQKQDLDWWKIKADADQKVVSVKDLNPKIHTSFDKIFPGFSAKIKSQIPSNHFEILQAGENAPVLQIARDFAIYSIAKVSDLYSRSLRDISKNLSDSSREVFRILLVENGLQKDAHLRLRVRCRQSGDIAQISYSVVVNPVHWLVNLEVPTSPLSMHELLELQLRLRDGLRPILTPTEIAEFLAPPNRR